MHPITIEPVRKPTLRAIAGVFIGTFATLWLLLEPLGAFGLTPELSFITGLITYSLLTAISLLVAILFIPTYKNFRNTKNTYINFKIELASDGAEHLVRSPTNMLTSDFINQFIEHLSNGPAKDRVTALNRTHYPVLRLITEDGASEVKNNITIKESGISEGSRCYISARPRESEIRFSLRSSDDNSN